MIQCWSTTFLLRILLQYKESIISLFNLSLHHNSARIQLAITQLSKV